MFHFYCSEYRTIVYSFFEMLYELISCWIFFPLKCEFYISSVLEYIVLPSFNEFDNVLNQIYFVRKNMRFPEIQSYRLNTALSLCCKLMR